MNEIAVCLVFGAAFSVVCTLFMLLGVNVDNVNEIFGINDKN
jgi:hypothetical protein